MFVARYRSGKDGVSAIDLDHLIEAIILEDQGKLADALDEKEFLRPVFEKKAQFFSTEIASELVFKIQQLFQRLEPIPTSVDMPVTDDVKRTFTAASTLTAELNHKQVEPLHLLAAGLSERSDATKLLIAAGITRDDVIMALKNDEDQH